MTVAFESLTFEVLGHASVRIESGDGTVVYVDPWSDVIGEYAADADVVFVTHDDYDHYDPDAIATVSTPETTVVSYEAVDTAALDREVVDLVYDGSATIDGIDVSAVPAYNDPDGPHVREDGSPFHAEGEVVGLLLTMDGTTVYFPSDTDFLPAHESIDADVLIPPIGGTYTMDRTEAAAMARAIRPSLVIPVHYDTFEAIETDETAFADELAAADVEVGID